MNTPPTILQTFAGPLELHPTDETHLFAKDQHKTGTPLLINRIPHTLQIFFEKGPTGWAHRNQYVTLRRLCESLGDTSPSLAATRTVLERLVPAVIAWAEEHPDEFRLAGAVSLAQNITRQESQVAEKTEELRDATTTLEQMRGDLASLERELNLDVRAYAETTA